MIDSSRRIVRSLAGFCLPALVVCMGCVGSVFAQQPQLPSIPDDVIWEPAIEYAIAGAMNREMTALAFGAKCGLLGNRGESAGALEASS